MSIVVGFQWPEGVPVDHPERQPTAIKVLVDKERVGQEARQVARERDGIVGDAPYTPVFITPATSNFLDMTMRLHLQRYQVPLELASTMTIYRVQKFRMDRAVIDLGSDIFAHGQASVARSIVRTLAGVLLCNFNLACLRFTDPKVLDEYSRLQSLV